jgi:hypothetical protein
LLNRDVSLHRDVSLPGRVVAQGHVVAQECVNAYGFANHTDAPMCRNGYCSKAILMCKEDLMG